MISRVAAATSGRGLGFARRARRQLRRAALGALLLYAAGCGRSVPSEYGMYVYEGRRPIPLERGTYAAVESEPGWLLNFMASTAADPESDEATVMAGVEDPAKLEILVFFQDLQAANVLMFRTEYDLLVEDVVVVDDFPKILKREIYENRRDVIGRGIPTACLDDWLKPIDTELWPYGRTYWKPRLEGGSARRGLFRESERRDNKVELTIAPIEGTPDAFLLTPTIPPEPGVYLLLVKGDDAGTMTQGRGGALVRVGPRAGLSALIDSGLTESRQNLARHDLTALSSSPPKTADKR